ncbi:PilZ domain-containing protein [Pseudenhygromyxa sp. WMMC2535]|uniref:PilZ domain-containing protein n=1 Tax=Pseudenhygromyxa sp. WMMC2535 TaxID=2712867 RepID=UPI001551CBC5|nr:PilZ domain-containing protein [Pseudenhygromyxa sp. WMMC2535]NVB40222.1 PilZ domain-containing protein [Pseudenhygromyxa sp. WMMC2535]
MDNRRNFARVEHQILVSYAHYEPGPDHIKDEEGLAKTLNMSVQGLLLLIPRSVEVGSRLQLTLDLDGEIVESLVARVARCEPAEGEMYNIGVALEHVPDRFIEAVERYFSSKG